MSLNLKEHLQQLSETPAPSGHEAPVRAAIQAVWAPLVDAFESDGLGNVIALKHGSGPEPRRRIMLCAHMDEIGMIVADICDGFIRTLPLGGIDYRVLLMQPVLVHGRKTLPGVFGAAPPHMSRERGKYPTHNEMWIDVGLPADEVAAQVRLGDLVTFDAPFVALRGERVTGKSFDNRASVAAVTVCLDELTRHAHSWDVVAVAAVQEETNLGGAAVAAYQLQPDLAIAIDTTFGAQHNVSDDDGWALGDGPTIGRGPNFHPGLFKALRDLAKEQEIKVQVEILPGNSGTDAWSIQVSRAGVPTALISIPIRNMHTPSEVVDLRDVSRAGRLMAAFIETLADDTLDQIGWRLPSNSDDSGADKDGAA